MAGASPSLKRKFRLSALAATLIRLPVALMQYRKTEKF